MARDVGINRETSGEVPTCKIQSGTHDEVWDFRNDLGSNKCEPVICFRLLYVSTAIRTWYQWYYLFLPRFKNVTIMKEEWLHLIDTPRSHEDEIEDGE